MNNTQPPKQGSSLIGLMLGLMGLLLLLVSILGIVNTAFGWNLKLEVYGSGTELPKHWDAAIGLLAVALIWVGIYAMFTWVRPLRDFSRRRPWVTALIIIGGLVGVIVGITIWDNANIKERNAKWDAEQREDSIKTAEEEKTFFGSEPVPYRLAVWNPTAKPVELWIDTVPKGAIAPYRMVELRLPWEKVRVSVTQDGKELDDATLRPDTVKNHRASRLEVFRPDAPGEYSSTYFMVLDYSAAYAGGKLQATFDEEATTNKDMFIMSPSANEHGGPFFVLPNEPAPAESEARVFRIVPIPAEGLEDGSVQLDYARWLCKRIDKGENGASDSPKQQLRAWEER